MKPGQVDGSPFFVGLLSLLSIYALVAFVLVALTACGSGEPEPDGVKVSPPGCGAKLERCL